MVNSFVSPFVYFAACLFNCRETTTTIETGSYTHSDKLFFHLMTLLVKTSPVRNKTGCNDIEGPGGSSDLVTLKFSSSHTVDPQRDALKEQRHHFSLAHHLTLSLIRIAVLSVYLSHLSPLLSLFSHDVLTLLSRLKLSSEELIVGGAYSWSSTTPTCRARGEHPHCTTGTLISENSVAFPCVSLEAREKKSVWELCKFKLAKFLMERAVTPEWSCLELKHCCNQYRLSWGWRARTFRSPFVEIMETTVIFPRHAAN